MINLDKESIHIIEVMAIILLILTISGFIYGPEIGGQMISVSNETFSIPISDYNKITSGIDNTNLIPDNSNKKTHISGSVSGTPVPLSNSITNTEANRKPVKIATVSVEPGITIAIGNIG